MKKLSLGKIFYNVIEMVLFLFLIFIAVMGFFPKLSFFASRGLNFYAITSGSMEPAIKTGSLVYVTKFKPEELKKGDIITFFIKNEKTKNDVIVTHRINKIEKNIVFTVPKGKTKKTPNLSLKIWTKGDANNKVDDNYIELGQVLGKYSFSIPYLGSVVIFARTPAGFGALILLPAMILIILEIISIVKYFKNKYQNDAKEEIAELRKKLENRKKK